MAGTPLKGEVNAIQDHISPSSILGQGVKKWLKDTVETIKIAVAGLLGLNLGNNLLSKVGIFVLSKVIIDFLDMIISNIHIKTIRRYKNVK